MNSQGPELEQRLEREAAFHDRKYATHSDTPRHYAAGPTQYVYRQMRDSLGDLNGKHILEYGCGEGWITSDLAQRGARVSAFDVSPQAVANTEARLAELKLSDRCHIEVMPAERLTFSDDTFDLALGFAIIHHLDLVKALGELHRVLKPGGSAVFAEPLATNPAIHLYRLLTPQYRSDDEAPLRLGELPKLVGAFSSYEHREFFLTAIGAVALTYLPGGNRLFPVLSSALHGVDRALLRIAPALGPLAWYTVFKVTK